LPIEPSHVLQTAESLASAERKCEGGSQKQEAFSRSAVSRFYYAAYKFAHNYAYDQGFRESNYYTQHRKHNDPEEDRLGLHECLWDWWFESTEIGELGSSLHGLRKWADYRLNHEFPVKTVVAAQAHATKIFKIIETWQADSK
jgi:hypothetical protein